MEGEKCEICYAVDLCEETKKVLDCKHFLCNSCYKRLLKKECPFCRYPFGSYNEIKKGEQDISQGYIEAMYSINIGNNINSNYYYNSPSIENYSNSLPNNYTYEMNRNILSNSRVGRRMKRREKKNKRQRRLANYIDDIVV